MKIIIKKLTKNKIYLSNDEVIDVSPDIIHEYKLRTNEDISDRYIKILRVSIKHKALYYIYLKPRTKYELLSKLKSKYTNSGLIEEVISYLEEERYIDDVDFALSYILTHEGSRQKISFKLMQKGVKKADIDKAYEDAPENMEEDILSKEIAKLKDKGMDLPRMIITLTRKGYSYYKIKKEIEKNK